MKIEMSYENPAISVAEIPDSCEVDFYEPKERPALSDEDFKNSLLENLERPISSSPLSEELRDVKKALILSDDNTRTTNTRAIIEAIIENYPDTQFDVIISLGTHRLMSQEEIREKLGPKVLKQCKVVQHDWKTAKFHDFGTTKSGVPVLINDIIDEYDYIIGLGQVVPHRCTGFSAGTKIVQPGISAGETTEETHWLSAKYKVDETMGKRDNGIRDELDEIGLKSGLKFIVNVVQNKENKTVGIFSGHPVEAHKKAAKMALDVFGFKAEPSEIVISESHPADLEMWQASKGIYSAVSVVKEGGTLILVTPCPEGVSKTFGEELLKFGYKHEYEEIKKLVDEKMISNKILASHIVHAGEVFFKAKQVLLVSPGLSEEESSKLGFKKVETLQEAVDMALKEYENPRISVMKFAADLLPL